MTISRKFVMLWVIAAIVGIFAYSTFINVD
jgi:hypothetical protein